MTVDLTVDPVSPEMTVEVRPGTIVLNSIDLVVDRPDAKVLLVDCHTKRGDGLGSVDEAGDFTVLLTATEETLHAADLDEATSVMIRGLGDHWNMEVFYSRYTVYIFLWKLAPPVSFRNLWTRPADSGKEFGS